MQMKRERTAASVDVENIFLRSVEWGASVSMFMHFSCFWILISLAISVRRWSITPTLETKGKYKLFEKGSFLLELTSDFSGFVSEEEKSGFAVKYLENENGTFLTQYESRNTISESRLGMWRRMEHTESEISETDNIRINDDLVNKVIEDQIM